MFLVLGFRGAWVLHAPPRVPKQRRPWDAAVRPVSGSRLAGSPAWRGLPQCPGYEHWVSYCCVVLVFGFWFRSNPATPGLGLRCVCLGTGFGFAPPFSAGVCGVCGWARVWACTQPILAGALGRVCLCAHSACTSSFLTRLCGVGVCAWARSSAAPCQSWLVCWGLCVFVCVLLLCPASPGWGVRCGCVRLGSGLGCARPLLPGVLGSVCFCVRAPVPRQSWLGCAVCVCVIGLGFRLRPASPGWGVGVCVCLCVRSSCTRPLLAGVCAVGLCACARVWTASRLFWLGRWRLFVFVCALLLYPADPGGVCSVGVCACARASAAPRQSWLGCWGLCLFVCALPCTLPFLAGVCSAGVCALARVLAAPRHSWLGCWGPCLFVCALLLYPAIPGWGVRCGCVCLDSGLGCAPPLLAWVLGSDRVCVCARPVPRHSWLGCAVWLRLLGLRFRLHPASPGWGVGVCVCLSARSSCTPPILAGVCGMGVCAWAPVSAAPRHAWLGCWGLCVFMCALPLYPATPGQDVRCGCLCWGCGFGCAPPPLARVLGSVCVCVRAPPEPRHSPLGCAVSVCVLGLRFWLRPANPGWAVGVCVCLCARSSRTPLLLAGVYGVGVCAWAGVSAAPRHAWLECWALCVFVCAVLLYAATPGLRVRRRCVCFGSGFGCPPSILAGVLGSVCVCVRAPLVPRHCWLDVRCGCVCLSLGFGCAPPLLAVVLTYCVTPPEDRQDDVLHHFWWREGVEAPMLHRRQA